MALLLCDNSLLVLPAGVVAGLSEVIRESRHYTYRVTAPLVALCLSAWGPAAITGYPPAAAQNDLPDAPHSSVV